MGFLAFLVIGGGSSLASWIFYPRRSLRPTPIYRLLGAILLGFIVALGSSYIGQMGYFYQSGQMLEWFSAIVASGIAGAVWAASFK
ncbi:hypothetical protein G6734_04885 [Polynucleobacter paneuropaeus]|nr:hypothetical protein [Polynucleobacter paneuropaeus]